MNDDECARIVTSFLTFYLTEISLTLYAIMRNLSRDFLDGNDRLPLKIEQMSGDKFRQWASFTTNREFVSYLLKLQFFITSGNLYFGIFSSEMDDI